jgi:hypothetical protein
LKSSAASHSIYSFGGKLVECAAERETVKTNNNVIVGWNSAFLSGATTISTPLTLKDKFY